MTTLVIGGGVIGVAAAWSLARAGHSVTLVEKSERLGTGASFANGALITPSMSEPWNSPGSWKMLAASLWRSDTPVKLHAHTLPGLVGWGAGFLRHSSPARFEHNTHANLRLALYSRALFDELRERSGIDFDIAREGSLRLFRAPAALDAAVKTARALESNGLTFTRLSAAEAAELEPGLAPIADGLAGAILYDLDAVGDAHRFCVALGREACRLGVTVRPGVKVDAIETRRGCVAHVRAGDEELSATNYVLAAGVDSLALARGIGVALPLAPVKGYSATVPMHAPLPLGIPVIDDALHAAVVPLREAIRIVGTAEFAGFDTSIDPNRIETLFSLLTEILPGIELDRAGARQWCGLRPTSVDGVPLIGATSIPNLFLNAGHGHLGWTMALGSGAILADILGGRSPAIDSEPFRPARFPALR